MKTELTLTLLSNIIINVLINYYDTLLDDRDYLFESKLFTFLNKKEKIFVYVIDFFIIFVQAKNTIEISIILLKNIRLNTVIEYAVDEYYQVSYKLTSLIVCD